MQEVNAICDRVVIINDGKIVANSTVSELKNTASSGITLQIQVSGELNRQLLDEISGITSVSRLEGFRWKITSSVDIRPEVTRIVAKEKLDLLELTTVENSMEDIFMKLTGGEG